MVQEVRGYRGTEDAGGKGSARVHGVQVVQVVQGVHVHTLAHQQNKFHSTYICPL